jgi:hypothetical protein
MNHVVHEFKANSAEDDQDQGFDEQLRSVRSRIERTFAWMDKYHIFHATDRLEEQVSGLAYICFALEQHRRLTNKPVYDVWVEALVVDWRSATRCLCLWHKNPALVIEAKTHRGVIIQHLKDHGCGVVACTKPPSKRARE